MGKKISKKDRLDAMLQMWSVLRDINIHRPFSTRHPDLAFMSSLQIELAKTLGIPSLLQKPEVKTLIEDLKKIRKDGFISPTSTALELDSVIERLEHTMRKEPAIPVIPPNEEERYEADVQKGLTDAREKIEQDLTEGADDPETPQ